MTRSDSKRGVLAAEERLNGSGQELGDQWEATAVGQKRGDGGFVSFIAGRNAKQYSHLGRQFGSFFKKRNILLPYNPTVVVLGIYSNEPEKSAYNYL